VRPDPRAFGIFERGKVGRGFQLRQRGLFQRFDFVQQRGHKELGAEFIRNLEKQEED
jgi:hypothetical protein